MPIKPSVMRTVSQMHMVADPTHNLFHWLDLANPDCQGPNMYAHSVIKMTSLPMLLSLPNSSCLPTQPGIASRYLQEVVLAHVEDPALQPREVMQVLEPERLRTAGPPQHCLWLRACGANCWMQLCWGSYLLGLVTRSREPGLSLFQTVL